MLNELCPKDLVKYTPNAANLVADFAAELSITISISGMLSNISSAAVGVILSAPITQRTVSPLETSKFEKKNKVNGQYLQIVCVYATCD